MSYRHDWIERIRRVFVPQLGVVAALFEDITGEKLYLQTSARRNQFVGRIRMDEEAFERVLDEYGFVRNPISTLKSRGHEIEEGSWRYLLDDDEQIHLIFYDGSVEPDANTGELFLYAHKEYRWDEYPIRHAMHKNFSAPAGVRFVRRMLQDEGIDYEFIQPG